MSVLHVVEQVFAVEVWVLVVVVCVLVLVVGVGERLSVVVEPVPVAGVVLVEGY